MATTVLILTTGEALEVDGALEDVAKALENATRSSAGTLAWFDEAPAEDRIGINPAHVVSVRRGRDPAPSGGRPPSE